MCLLQTEESLALSNPLFLHNEILIKSGATVQIASDLLDRYLRH
jgi:hypothetical protein